MSVEKIIFSTILCDFSKFLRVAAFFFFVYVLTIKLTTRSKTRNKMRIIILWNIIYTNIMWMKHKNN